MADLGVRLYPFLRAIHCDGMNKKKPSKINYKISEKSQHLSQEVGSNHFDKTGHLKKIHEEDARRNLLFCFLIFVAVAMTAIC